MSRVRDYGDACGATRTAIREVLAHSGFITPHPQAEALVEKLLWKLHDESLAWALREIIDRPEHLRRKPV
jgi:hypothetical protein